MIQLLYTVILAEMALILTLLFRTPLRKLVIMALDRVKRGRGPRRGQDGGRHGARRARLQPL